MVTPRCRGTSLIRNSPPPPWDCHRALDMVIWKGLGGALFLMSEMPRHSLLTRKAFSLGFSELTGAKKMACMCKLC